MMRLREPFWKRNRFVPKYNGTFHLSNLYSELATMLMDLQRYPEAAEAVEKGKACIPLPDYIWGLKAKETHLLAQTGQTDKAKALFNEIKDGQNGN